MPYATYDAFRVGVNNLIEGDDCVGSTFSVATLDLIIEMAEARVHRDLRASSMIADLSETVTSNAADLPADLLELQQVYFSGKKPLEIRSLEAVQERIQTAAGSGDAIYAAQRGDTLIFWPEASGTVLGSYYAKPDALKTGGLHATFLRYPEVYVYACLVEALAHVGMEEREQVLEKRYLQKLAAAHQDEQVRVQGSGRLRVRAS